MLLLYLLERVCNAKWNATLITLTLSLLIAPFTTRQLPVNMIAVKRLHCLALKASVTLYPVLKYFQMTKKTGAISVL